MSRVVAFYLINSNNNNINNNNNNNNINAVNIIVAARVAITSVQSNYGKSLIAVLSPLVATNGFIRS